MVFPYPKGFHNNKVWFILHFLWIYCGAFVFRYLVLKNWYHSTFFDHKKGRIFFSIFAYFFKKTKEGWDTMEKFIISM
jgi:hypothetical protein